MTEKIENEEIFITTTKPGVPLLIKVSYHPGWRVEGADKVYLTSPAFMLIYPKASNVRLYYGNTVWNYIGFFFTALGLASIVFGLFLAGGSRSAEALRVHIHTSSFAARLRTIADAVEARNTLIVGIVALIFVIVAAQIILSVQNDPLRLCNKAMNLRDRQRFQEARSIYQRVISNHPGFSKADEAYYYLAICFYKEKNWQKTIEIFTTLVNTYPDSPWAPEALFHIGKCHVFLKNQQKANEYFDLIITEYPVTVWANYSKEWRK